MAMTPPPTPSAPRPRSTSATILTNAADPSAYESFVSFASPVIPASPAATTSMRPITSSSTLTPNAVVPSHVRPSFSDAQGSRSPSHPLHGPTTQLGEGGELFSGRTESSALSSSSGASGLQPVYGIPLETDVQMGRDVVGIPHGSRPNSLLRRDPNVSMVPLLQLSRLHANGSADIVSRLDGLPRRSSPLQAQPPRGRRSQDEDVNDEPFAPSCAHAETHLAIHPALFALLLIFFPIGLLYCLCFPVTECVECGLKW